MLRMDRTLLIAAALLHVVVQAQGALSGRGWGGLYSPALALLLTLHTCPAGITPPCAGAPVVSEAAEPARVACGACTAATPAPACCCRRRESCHESCRRCE